MHSLLERIEKLLQRNEVTRRTNLSAAELTQFVIEGHEGKLSHTGAIVVKTGLYTGRSPKDKFIVDSESTHECVDWGSVNHPLSQVHFDYTLSRACDFLTTRPVYIVDVMAGVFPGRSLKIRAITEFAWHALFARQLFAPLPESLALQEPDFTIISLPSFKIDPNTDGVRSDVSISLDFAGRVGLIAGTEYAGEIKKSIFTVANYVFPLRDIFTMHCSATIGSEGDTALYFGLSGTGKTTLSADPKRLLIGDDEHAWSDDGVFNVEGGCYAKCVGLDETQEPDIFGAIKFGAILENVVLDESSRIPDYDDVALTENTRAAYPLSHIPGLAADRRGGHASTIFLLTADATGVLPPVSLLSHDQAMYYFLSGYTSKLAGTERGVVAPEPNFSACFGAPFWPLPPAYYANLFERRLAVHNPKCYLINTGWTGGGYGAGTRVPLAVTRAIVHAALEGRITHENCVNEPFFGLSIPQSVPGVPTEALTPSIAWKDDALYEAAARNLARQFVANFAKFEKTITAISKAGPRVG